VEEKNKKKRKLALPREGPARLSVPISGESGKGKRGADNAVYSRKEPSMVEVGLEGGGVRVGGALRIPHKNVEDLEGGTGRAEELSPYPVV